MRRTGRSGRHRTSSPPVEAARAGLAAATERAEQHVVVVSSALVYGAWENNPVPLEETRTLRPRPEIADAVALATAEDLVEQWRRDAPGRTATILRPVTVVDPGAHGAMIDQFARTLGSIRSQTPAPAQFLARSDLDAAVELCRHARPDAVLNVAPPGMITGERLRELTPGTFSVPVPGALAEMFDLWRASVTVGPGALAHVRHPWVVSADRLRSLGWEAAVSNEQAFVSGTAEGWFASLSAKRRQEAALLGATAAVAMVAAILVGWSRRGRRR